MCVSVVARGCSRVNDEETHMCALRKQMEADSGLGHGRMRIFLGELECPRVNNEVIGKPRNPSNRKNPFHRGRPLSQRRQKQPFPRPARRDNERDNLHLRGGYDPCTLPTSVCFGISTAEISDRKFNPALFARLAAGDGFALIHRCRALRREACCACARPIAMPVPPRDWRRKSECPLEMSAAAFLIALRRRTHAISAYASKRSRMLLR